MKPFLKILFRFWVHPNIFIPSLMVVGAIVGQFFKREMGAANWFEAAFGGAAIPLMFIGALFLLGLVLAGCGTAIISVIQGIKKAIDDSK
jgi:H+/gluconate symporter-like permease